MPLNATNFFPGGPIKAADMLQYYNLFTGVMLDQPVTFANTLQIGGSQSTGSVPFRVSSVAAGTANVIEVRTLPTDANPVLAIARTGPISLGAGGGSALDASLTRSGVNEITASGTFKATTVSVVAGDLTLTAGVLHLGGATGVIAGGTVSTNFNNNANNATNLTITDAGLVSIPRGSLGVGVAAASSQTVHITAPAATQTGLALDGTLTSAGGFAQGFLVNPTFIAGANSDSVYGISIAPTWNANTHNTLTAYGIYVQTGAVPAGFSTNYGIYVATPTGGSVTNIGVRISGGAPALQVDAGGLSIIGGGLLVGGTAPVVGANQIGLGGPIVGTGAGGAATLGQIGGSGPTINAQLNWLPINVAGANRFIPIWG